MQKSPLLIAGMVTVIGVLVLVVFSVLLTPAQVNPAYAVAIDFTNAAAKGDDDTAEALFIGDAVSYVETNCENGLVSACVRGYTPPEWGEMLAAVFRRSDPDGVNAWNVLLVATYEEAQGFSGVCIYNRVEKVDTSADDPAADLYEGWRVVSWSGFVSCDRDDAGLSALAREDAPNRVP